MENRITETYDAMKRVITLSSECSSVDVGVVTPTTEHYTEDGVFVPEVTEEEAQKKTLDLIDIAKERLMREIK